MRFFQRLKNWTTAQVVSLSLVVLIVATNWSLLTPQFFRVHDYTHGARIGELSRALADGHFPVRWSQNLGHGYGMPLFNYYAPLPYYVGAVFYGLGLDIILSIKLLFVLASIITAWGAYKLGKDWFGTWGGLILSAALTMAPYRALSLYVRGAVSEAWAIAFLPVILWALCRLIRGEKSAWGWLVAGLTGLFLSHNITTMLFIPVSILVGIIYALLIWSQKSGLRNLKQWWQAIWQVGSGYVLAIGLAAFYLLPAFLEKDLTKVEETILSGYFDYHLHFLYIRQFFTDNWGYGGSGWGPTDDISFFLGAAQLAGVSLVAIFSGWHIWQVFKDKTKAKPVLWKVLTLVGIGAGMAGLALFMSLEKSQAIWQASGILKFAQFPWRWLSVATVGIALGVAAIAALLPRVWWRGIVLVGLWLWLVLGNTYFFRPKEYLADSSGYYYTEPAKIQGGMSDVLPDYIPAQMAKYLVAPTRFWLNPDVSPESVTVLIERTQEKLIRVKTTSPLALDLAIADFPSWQVEIDGQPAAKTTGTIGNIQVLVPAGEHTVGVIWRSTPIESLGNWLSLVALAGLVGIALYPRLVAMAHLHQKAKS